MVPRPLLVRAALGAVAMLLVGPLAPPAAAAPVAAPTHAPATTGAVAAQGEEDDGAPLLITIESLTPGEVPRRGPVVVSGTVANRSVETWSAISLYPFINAGAGCTGCPPPMTTAEELVAATETEPDALVGNRITSASDTISELAPGEVASYSISVPRSELGVTEAGVYWFGVHASGASPSTPRDGLADGRARTFLPHLPGSIDGSVDTAVVVPLRHRVTHKAGGAIARVREWTTAFGPRGSLGGPLGFGASSGGRPVSWLIDPAVPDVARRLVEGNPGRDLGPTGDRPEDAEPTDDGDPDDTDDPDDSEDSDGTDTTDDTSGTEPTAPEGEPTLGSDADASSGIAPVVAGARSWLENLQLQVRGEEVLALPYGDLDVSGAAGGADASGTSATTAATEGLYPLARGRTGDVLTDWGTSTTPVIAPTDGYLDPAALESLEEVDDDSVVLLSDRMFADTATYPDGPPGVARHGQQRIGVTSYDVSAGGPGPDPRLAPVTLRQRVLAEAALRLVDSGPARPLIVVVPAQVTGRDAGRFWSGLDVDWLDLTTVADLTSRQAPPVSAQTLTYPDEQADDELDGAIFDEAAQLVRAGATLQNLLPQSEQVAGQVRDEALTSASTQYRGRSRTAAFQLERSRTWIDRRLGGVRIDAPPGVTLSSDDGSFSVTIHNRLRRAVSVQLAATSNDQIDVDVGEPVLLGPRSRTTVLLHAHTSGTGVSNVSLALTDSEGTPLGSADQVPIRSGRVSDVIWLILGAGVGILFLAIGLRIYRRIRRRGADQPADQPAAESTTEPGERT